MIDTPTPKVLAVYSAIPVFISLTVSACVVWLVDIRLSPDTIIWQLAFAPVLLLVLFIALALVIYAVAQRPLGAFSEKWPQRATWIVVLFFLAPYTFWIPLEFWGYVRSARVLGVSDANAISMLGNSLPAVARPTFWSAVGMIGVLFIKNSVNHAAKAVGCALLVLGLGLLFYSVTTLWQAFQAFSG